MGEESECSFVAELGGTDKGADILARNPMTVSREAPVGPGVAR